MWPSTHMHRHASNFSPWKWSSQTQKIINVSFVLNKPFSALAETRRTKSFNPNRNDSTIYPFNFCCCRCFVAWDKRKTNELKTGSNQWNNEKKWTFDTRAQYTCWCTLQNCQTHTHNFNMISNSICWRERTRKMNDFEWAKWTVKPLQIETNSI